MSIIAAPKVLVICARGAKFGITFALLVAPAAKPEPVPKPPILWSEYKVAVVSPDNG